MAVKRPPRGASYQPKHIIKPLAYWRRRGLQMVFLGNRCVWNRDDQASGDPPTIVGGPKHNTGPYGVAQGFGTTYGTGLTDYLGGNKLSPPNMGGRSILSFMYAKTVGGGGFGRVYQDASGSGLTVGESLYLSTTGVTFVFTDVSSTLTSAWTPAFTVPTGRWCAVGIAVPFLPTVASTARAFLDGKFIASAANANGVSPGSNAATNMTWGNRAAAPGNERQFDGMIGPTLIFDGVLDDRDFADLSANPWRVFPETQRRCIPATSGTLSRSISEALSLADAASQAAALGASASEAAALAESASIVAALSAAGSEAVTLGHTQDAVVGRFSSVSEALALLDSASNVAAFGATATEPMSLASSATNVAALSASASEAMTLADARSAAAAGDYAASITEAVALADAQSNVAALSASLTEAVALDSAASATAAGDYAASVTESATLAASGSNVAALSSTIAESATLASSASNVAALSAAISEAINFAASHAGALPGTFTVGIAEAMALNDATTVQAALSAALVEAMSLADGAAAPWAVYVAIVEAANLADTLGSVLNAALYQSYLYLVAAELRDYSIRSEARSQAVAAESRTQNVPATI